LDSPKLVIFETPDGHPTWLESYRELTNLGDGRTEMIYRLSSDIAHSGMIGAFYAKVLKMIYEPRLPKYLKTLKGLMEEKA
jgi:hypothetical protein